MPQNPSNDVQDWWGKIPLEGDGANFEWIDFVCADGRRNDQLDHQWGETTTTDKMSPLYLQSI